MRYPKNTTPYVVINNLNEIIYHVNGNCYEQALLRFECFTGRTLKENEQLVTFGDWKDEQRLIREQMGI